MSPGHYPDPCPSPHGGLHPCPCVPRVVPTLCPSPWGGPQPCPHAPWMVCSPMSTSLGWPLALSPCPWDGSQPRVHLPGGIPTPRLCPQDGPSPMVPHLPEVGPNPLSPWCPSPQDGALPCSHVLAVVPSLIPMSLGWHPVPCPSPQGGTQPVSPWWSPVPHHAHLHPICDARLPRWYLIPCPHQACDPRVVPSHVPISSGWSPPHARVPGVMPAPSPCPCSAHPQYTCPQPCPGDSGRCSPARPAG